VLDSIATTKTASNEKVTELRQHFSELEQTWSASHGRSGSARGGESDAGTMSGTGTSGMGTGTYGSGTTTSGTSGEGTAGTTGSSTDWQTHYAALDGILTDLLGPASRGASGTSGRGSTSGTAAIPESGSMSGSMSSTSLDRTTRKKLQEFRVHLQEFHEATMGESGDTAPPSM